MVVDMARPTLSKIAPGIFQRGEVYWLRYSANGVQVRVSLQTSDRKLAYERAEELRGRAVVCAKTGKAIGEKSELERQVAKYTTEKLRAGKYVQTSADNATRAITYFAEMQGITDPAKITSPILADFYTKLQEITSEATAQTYVTRVATFATWAGMRVTTPEFSSDAPSREITIASDRVPELLGLATGEMKFILLAGFRAGLRRGEITMARPQWFDLARNRIHIPSKDPLTGFIPKSGRARTIPLVSEFREFINAEYPDWTTRKFCLRPEKSMGKWKYRFDFRQMFESFAKKNCEELTPHVMRHSYASHLANAGIGIAQLASWTGDRIATLEKHYLHLESDAEKAEAAFYVEPKAPSWMQDVIDSDVNEPVKPRTRDMCDY